MQLSYNVEVALLFSTNLEHIDAIVLTWHQFKNCFGLEIQEQPLPLSHYYKICDLPRVKRTVMSCGSAARHMAECRCGCVPGEVPPYCLDCLINTCKVAHSTNMKQWKLLLVNGIDC